ncbi:MAG: hypothetical protein E7231_09620 [Cellulosilyticum sp.]|nr:hypothetical protein [Cellulosilyticum sp.]
MTRGKWNIQTKIIGVICALILIFICCFFMLKFMYNMQNTTLQSTWKSDETGQILSFTPDNRVVFDGGSSNGIYYILSTDTMEYTIEGQTFQMMYYIKDQKLYWGIDKNHLECFTKRWY